MDQLKELFAKLGKHGFWIACGLVTVISLAVWWIATASLVEEYEREASNLDAAVSAISSIQSEIATHPNDASHEMMENLVAEQREEVLEAWRMQYRDQQEILVWPQRLGEEFISEFAPLVPIELNFQEFPVPDDMEKETTLRERYRDYIKDVMEPLAKKAGAEWKADFDAGNRAIGGMGGMGGIGGYDMGMGVGGPGMEPGGYGTEAGLMGRNGQVSQKKPPLVEWSTQSQEALLSDLFPWRGQIPSTLEVLYSQENLWVLDQLLQIIADTNGDVTQRFQAKIHEIQAIGIGRSATRAAGIISRVEGAGGGGPGAGMGGGMMGGGMMGGDMGYGSEAGGYGAGGTLGGGMDGGMGGGMMGGDMGGGMMGVDMGYGSEGGYGTGGQMVRDPAEGRYVDGDYKPIEAARVRSAMVSNSPEDASLAVAKRIPVKLRLKMDQRSIPKLLAICGNASLMVEVRQIRINPTGSASGMSGGYGMGAGPGLGGGPGMSGGPGMGGGGYGGDMTGYGADSGGGYGGSMGGPSGMLGSGIGGRNARQTFPMDMAVEVYGIIYLFNPPAAERLGIEQVNEDTVIDGKSMAEEAVDEGVRPAPVGGAVNPPPVPDESPDPSAQPGEPSGAADSGANGNGANAGETQAGPPGTRPAAPAPGAGNQGQAPAVNPAAPANP